MYLLKVFNNKMLKGQLQRFCKFVLYEIALKILKNDICITEIGQAVLEIFNFKDDFPRKIPKIRIFQINGFSVENNRIDDVIYALSIIK